MAKANVTLGRLGTKGDFICPKGKFVFCAITGQGVLNERSKEYFYKAQLELDLEDDGVEELLNNLDDAIEAENFKGKQTKHAYQTHDDYDGVPEGKVWIEARTSVEFEDKKTGEVKPVEVGIYDTRGDKSKLPEGIGIGEGSTGKMFGKIEMWDASTKNVKEWGVSIYLSSIQIADFVPYEFGEAPDEMEGSFKGFKTPDLEKDEEQEEEEKPRRRSRRSRR